MELNSKVIQKYSKYSVAQLLKIAQKHFNSFIRKRDEGLPCVSCGSGKPTHASHFMSQGHHSALRFEEDNVHLACVRCNVFLHGNLINYRKALVSKIGEERVIYLETYPQKAHKWDRFTLIEKIEFYKHKK